MAAETPAGLIESLAREDYEAIVGTAEAYWVDFKRDPYVLDTARGQWELAKDVAAMAESRGGLIVIGYSTEKHLTEGIEAASEHHPVPKRLVNPEQYRDIISQRVYPHVTDIATHWFPPGVEEESGVFVIEISSQPDESKPFLVKRMIDEEDTEYPSFVGFPRRDGDRVVWLPPEAVHHQINSARRFEFRTFDLSRGKEPSDTSVALQRELAATVTAAEADDEAWLSYQAIGRQNGHRAAPLLVERVSDLLSDPPSVRPGGFNFRTGGEPVWLSGGTIEVSGRSMALRVNTALGIVTAVFAANESCLGWALSQYMPEGAPLRMNPITLAEYTLEYFRLLDEQLAPLFLDPPQPRWSALVNARRMKSEKIVLQPGPLRGQGIPASLPVREQLGQADDWEMSLTTSGDAEADAFAALVHVYALFGLKSNQIPYSAEGRVLTEEVAAL